MPRSITQAKSQEQGAAPSNTMVFRQQLAGPQDTGKVVAIVKCMHKHRQDTNLQKQASKVA